MIWKRFLHYCAFRRKPRKPSKAEPFLVWTSCWTHSPVSGDDLRHNDAYMTSLSWRIYVGMKWVIMGPDDIISFFYQPVLIVYLTLTFLALLQCQISYFEKCISWWRHQMETFSASLALCEGNSAVTGEFPSQRPVTRSFDVFFDLRLKKWLSKHSRRRWFETLSHSLWRHCNL